jgi:hypothetical protein
VVGASAAGQLCRPVASDTGDWRWPVVPATVGGQFARQLDKSLARWFGMHLADDGLTLLEAMGKKVHAQQHQIVEHGSL